LFFLLALGVARTATAQVVGIALDGKAELVNGDVRILPSPPPDSVVFLEFSGAKSRTLGRIAAAGRAHASGRTRR
jgi:hypothetical protein